MKIHLQKGDGLPILLGILALAVLSGGLLHIPVASPATHGLMNRRAHTATDWLSCQEILQLTEVRVRLLFFSAHGLP